MKFILILGILAMISNAAMSASSSGEKKQSNPGKSRSEKKANQDAGDSSKGKLSVSRKTKNKEKTDLDADAAESIKGKSCGSQKSINETKINLDASSSRKGKSFKLPKSSRQKNKAIDLGDSAKREDINISLRKSDDKVMDLVASSSEDKKDSNSQKLGSIHQDSIDDEYDYTKIEDFIHATLTKMCTSDDASSDNDESMNLPPMENCISGQIYMIQYNTSNHYNSMAANIEKGSKWIKRCWGGEGNYTKIVNTIIVESNRIHVPNIPNALSEIITEVNDKFHNFDDIFKEDPLSRLSFYRFENNFIAEIYESTKKLKNLYKRLPPWDTSRSKIEEICVDMHSNLIKMFATMLFKQKDQRVTTSFDSIKS